MIDYIRKSIAIEALKARFEQLYPKARDSEYIPLIKHFQDAMMVIESLPESDVVEQKHGQWIRSVDELGEAWMCSECLEEFFPADGMDEFISYVHYCPNCGARMDGDS